MRAAKLQRSVRLLPFERLSAMEELLWDDDRGLCGGQHQIKQMRATKNAVVLGGDGNDAV